MTGIVSVYATFGSDDEARGIGRQMVDERLAACVNVLGASHSIYRWQGRIETEDEVAAIFKTTEGCAELLVRRLSDVHSYDNPCVAVWPISNAPHAYVQWVRGQVR
jgi:periplasmic divalent cation tolerance protein